MVAVARELMDGYRSSVTIRGVTAEAIYLVSGMVDPGSLDEAYAAGVPKVGEPSRRPGMEQAVCRGVQLIRVISPSAALFRAEFHSVGMWPSVVRLSSARVSADTTERLGSVIAHGAIAWSTPTSGLTYWTHRPFLRIRGVHEIVEVRDRYTPPPLFHGFMARNLLRAYTIQGVPCVLRGATYQKDQSNQCRITTIFVTTSPLPEIPATAGVSDIDIPALGPLDDYGYAPPAQYEPPECVVIPAADRYPPGEDIPWMR